MKFIANYVIAQDGRLCWFERMEILTESPLGQAMVKQPVVRWIATEFSAGGVIVGEA